MTKPEPTTIDKIEADFLNGDISYAEYRRDLHHHYKRVLRAEPAVTWKDRASRDGFGFDQPEQEMGR